MPLTPISPPERIGAERGSVVVCVPAQAARRACSSTRRLDVPVVVYGDGDPRSDRDVFRTATLAQACTVADPADVVLLSASCAVAEGWLVGLREAANSDSRIATASAMPTPAGDTLPQAAAAVRTGALRLRPRLLAPSTPCVYVRRGALELAGALDDGFYLALQRARPVARAR